MLAEQLEKLDAHITQDRTWVTLIIRALAALSGAISLHHFGDRYENTPIGIATLATTAIAAVFVASLIIRFFKDILASIGAQRRWQRGRKIWDQFQGEGQPDEKVRKHIKARFNFSNKISEKTNDDQVDKMLIQTGAAKRLPWPKSDVNVIDEDL